MLTWDAAAEAGGGRRTGMCIRGSATWTSSWMSCGGGEWGKVKPRRPPHFCFMELHSFPSSPHPRPAHTFWLPPKLAPSWLLLRPEIQLLWPILWSYLFLPFPAYLTSPAPLGSSAFTNVSILHPPHISSANFMVQTIMTWPLDLFSSLLESSFSSMFAFLLPSVKPGRRILSLECKWRRMHHYNFTFQVEQNPHFFPWSETIHMVLFPSTFLMFRCHPLACHYLAEDLVSFLSEILQVLSALRLLPFPFLPSRCSCPNTQSTVFFHGSYYNSSAPLPHSSSQISHGSLLLCCYRCGLLSECDSWDSYSLLCQGAGLKGVPLLNSPTNISICSIVRHGL